MSRLMQREMDKDGSRQGTPADQVASQVRRIRSEDLFQQQREVEIDHQGRIYRLRLTQMNKLILTA
jgi:hemin uptake protein HemP